MTTESEVRAAVPTPDAKTWAEFEWPNWVPQKIRDQVEDFWSERAWRGPQSWMEDMRIQGAPDFGSVVTLPVLGGGQFSPLVTGRFVHAWNNIGRVVLPDGTFDYVSFYYKFDPEEYRQRHLEIIRKAKAETEERLKELAALEEQLAASPAGEVKG